MTPLRARTLHRLTARSVATLKNPGRHADGGGLYLVIEPSGAKRWPYLFRWKDDPSAKGSGRLREMGLGSVHVVTLAEARDAANEARRNVFRRIDPIQLRRQVREAPTFASLSEDVLRLRSEALTSDKTVARWRRSLFEYAKDLGPMPVDQITSQHVLAVLQPVWLRTPESAQKARGYLEAVFDHAKAHGYRQGENPAAWKGNLEQLLPQRPKHGREHHAALPFAEIPSFMARLRDVDSVPARALELLILTAGRVGEAREAVWSEMDLAAGLWTVPAIRMKKKREHRVPLSPAAFAVLESVTRHKLWSETYVFPGLNAGRPISATAISEVARRLAPGITVHGFRSSFRDWAGELTDYPREVAEAALAHVVGDQTEIAYRRGDALIKRRALMNDWAAYCA